MKTSINVLCYRSKTLANGEHPIMICVNQNRKRKYFGLGISIPEKYWDFEKGKPKSNCPNKVQIEQFILKKQKEIVDKISKLEVENKDYSITTLFSKGKVDKNQTVQELFLEYIDQLKQENRIGYSLSVKQALNSLIEFAHGSNLYFGDITSSWLKRYEIWQRNKQLAENTIGIRFRTLRVIYNLAIEKKLVNTDDYPFRSYKVSKLHQETAKRSITKEEIHKIIDYKVSPKEFYKRLALDLFTFSYLMGGINFMDMALLTSENIVDDRLVYFRKKTKKLIKLPLQDRAMQIIRYYQTKDRKYIFPILFDTHVSELQKRYRIHDVIADINKNLKSIGKELNLPIKLTTYVARHSFATVLKRSGVNTSLICEALGHSSERVTQIYLDSFGNDQMEDAMKKLL